ncbi:MAG: hypothetical protein R2713_00275 [Ilumatobacteraceae bacterium]
MVDGLRTAGIPIAWTPAAANTPDAQLVEDTLAILDTRGFEVGSETAHLDRRYDSVAIRDLFTETGIDAHIVHRARHVRGRKYGSRARNGPPSRATLEDRTGRAAWLSNWAFAATPTASPSSAEAALDLAITFVITVRLIKWRDRYGNTTFKPAY